MTTNKLGSFWGIVAVLAFVGFALAGVPAAHAFTAGTISSTGAGGSAVTTIFLTLLCGVLSVVGVTYISRKIN